ncbi:MAG: hypothetical protein ABL914_06040 [Novosphingobium sp.]|uniref:hypothetical protein n=1 Tax=Novosphingobium sp. TaxID=1874826 RepID=UPI0032BBB3D8
MADFLFSDILNQNLRSGTDIIQTSGRDTIGLAPWRYVSDALATAALFAAHPRFVARSSNGRYWRAVPEDGRVSIDAGGAKGDGIADDGPAMRATLAYVAAIGARGASFGASRYRIERILPGEASMPGNTPIQVVRQNDAAVDFGGATLTRQGGGRGIVFAPGQHGSVIGLPLAADVVAGSMEVTLAPGGAAQLVVGDTVVWQLGELPYDTPETLNWSFAIVSAIAGDVVRLDRPMPESLALASVTGNNKRLLKLQPLRDWSVRNVTLVGPAEEGISITYAERIRIENVGARMVGAGVVHAQYCEGLTLDDCWQDGSLTSQGSFGFAFTFGETRNTVLNRPRARATKGLVSVEAGGQITIIAGQFENSIVDAQGASLGSQVVVVNAVGRGSVTVHDLTVTGFGGYRLLETNNGQGGYDGVATFSGTLRLNHPTAPYSIPLNSITGTLEVTINAVREIYNFERLRHWRKRFVLRDGEYRYAFGPAGLLARARVYATPGVTVGTGQQLTGLWLGRQGSNGDNLAGGPSQQVEPGKDVNIRTYAGTVAGIQWSLRNQPLGLLCVTATGAGLNAANEFVEFEGWFAEQPDLDVVLSEDAVRTGGVEQDPLEAVFPAYDLPAIAAGASTVVSLPIPDMLASDFVDSVRFIGGFAGLELRSVEPQAASLRLVIANPGSSAIDRVPTELAVAFHHQTSGT